MSGGTKWALGALTFVISAYFMLGVGEQWINPIQARGQDATILWQLRLPRVVLAFAVGGLLALAGAWFQVLLGNALAEPYVLGVAGSSAAGAVLALAWMPDSAWAMSTGAFAGAWL